jgi:YXWGXW repeat-containing protein
MRKLTASLISILSISLTWGACALAQSDSTVGNSNFPTARFLQFPPHFQPRPVSAVDKISTAPPPLPSYAQPAIPEEGYLWMPGFWAWRNDVPDYYWVPGTWVKPPQAGLLWTPPYWSRVEGGFVFHAGYWAEAVGFYGGIDYGYGYTGDGYQGGHWDNGTFFYNSAANNLDSQTNARVYNQTIAADDQAGRMSFNGGSRGAKARPTPQQEKLAGDQHVAPTAEQRQQFELAAKDRSLYSKQNRDQPGIAATSRAGIFNGPAVTRSSGYDEHTTTGSGGKK